MAPQTPTQNFPVVFFLDFDIFQRGGVEIPRLTIPISSYIMGHIRDARLVAAEFFENNHPWMPIISKKRFYDHLMNPLSQPRADAIFLIFCMKLIAWSPLEQANESKPKTETYLVAKRFLVEAEAAGMFTFQLLQALLLVTFYELGHGIYPAAYMSVGACARYGLALGIDGQTLSMSSNSTLTLLEQEERRRSWWTCLILDRFDYLSLKHQCLAGASITVSDASYSIYMPKLTSSRIAEGGSTENKSFGDIANSYGSAMNLGCPRRSTTTQDPSPDDLLPADDGAYEQGVTSPEAIPYQKS